MEDESIPSTQRRWEGVIRVSKPRPGSGQSQTRVQELVADPNEVAVPPAPRVPSADTMRRSRWQPEPADWTSTVFGGELMHDLDCPLQEDGYEDHDHPVVEQAGASGAFEGEAPAPAAEPELPVVEPELLAAEPEDLAPEPEETAEIAIEGQERSDDDWHWVEFEPVDQPAEAELVGTAEAAETEVRVEYTEQWVDLEEFDLTYVELPVVVPPRPGPPAAEPRVPASRRESDSIAAETSIGATLAAARMSAGLTHDQLARITRIGVARLVEFENDDYSGCGADIFARGRLDSIARAVGVDPEPLLAEFDTRHSVPAARAGWASGGRPQIRMPRNWTIVLLCALAVVGVYPIALLIVAVLG